MRSRPRRRKAFTLVELLVVIGIIAVLISILLPTLSKARDAAKIVKCASNMRQIALGMIGYTNDNRGKLPPSVVNPGDKIYPKGWCWANELVAGRYVPAPTGTDSAGNALLLSDSVFRCPNGLDIPFGPNGFAALSPRDAINQQYMFLAYPTANDGVASWYALNSITHEGTPNGSAAMPGKSNDAPFAWYNAKTAGESDAFLKDGRFARSMTLIRKPSQVVMAFDGNTYNWNNIPGSTGLSARISGRHGKATNGTKDGMFNCAFFDGHVVLLSTEPYTRAGTGANALSITKGDVVFWLHDQY